jgi:hypothetical protein
VLLRAALDAGVTLVRHRRAVRLRQERNPGRPVLKAHRQDITLCSKGGMARCSSPTASSSASSTAAPRRSAQLRRQPAPPADRRDRPVLPAPLGQAGADRGERGRAGRSGARRQGAHHRPVGGVGRHAAQGACGAPDRRGAVRVFAVDAQCRDRGAAGLPPTSAPPMWPSARWPGASCAASRSTWQHAAGQGHPPRMPRFLGEQAAANLRMQAAYNAIARDAGCTPAQLALAWLLHKAPHIMPIPGTTAAWTICCARARCTGAGNGSSVCPGGG